MTVKTRAALSMSTLTQMQPTHFEIAVIKPSKCSLLMNEISSSRFAVIRSSIFFFHLNILTMRRTFIFGYIRCSISHPHPFRHLQWLATLRKPRRNRAHYEQQLCKIVIINVSLRCEVPPKSRLVQERDKSVYIVKVRINEGHEQILWRKLE